MCTISTECTLQSICWLQGTDSNHHSCTQAPDLYMGYGATRDAPPMYSFEYPASWEEQGVTKTDKSTMVSDRPDDGLACFAAQGEVV